MVFTINSKKYGIHTVEIDDEDWSKVKNYKWHVLYIPKRKTGLCHAIVTNVRKGDGQTNLYLHRLILPNFTFVDHIDGNPLNNKKSNLRGCTIAENNRNVKTSRTNTTGYKGVGWHTEKYKGIVYTRIRARISVNGKLIHLGLFPTLKAAALAYNEAALKYHGEFARLNEI